MLIPEDADMKIFTPSKGADKDAGALTFVEGMAHHRQNGNVDKAKKLGADIANTISNENQKKNLDDELFLSKEIFPQICALILFSTEAAFNYYLPAQQLSTIATNALHETLSKKKGLKLYDEVMASPAFSFYYLSVRKGGQNIPKDVGEAFAMLCHKTNEEKFINQGKHLYEKVLKDVEKRILELEFEN